MDHMPLEIQKEVLSHLDIADLKRIRLLNRYFNAIATPLCFTTIWLDPRHNLRQIINVASGPLAQHVTKLILWTTPLLRRFDSYDLWERSLALPGDPEEDPDAIADFGCDDIFYVP